MCARVFVSVCVRHTERGRGGRERKREREREKERERIKSATLTDCPLILYNFKTDWALDINNYHQCPTCKL